MPPPFEAYQHAGYGQYAAYEQSDAFPMQQQQSMAAPSVSSPLVQQNQNQNQNQHYHQAHQWQNVHNYNYNQPFVSPSQLQQQTYQLPPQQTPQFPHPTQYQHSSPLQHFATGQLQDSRQQQQYWPQSNQSVDYPTPYQPSQSQAQSGQVNGQAYLPPQHDLRQSIAPSPVLSHPGTAGQAGYAPVSGQRAQQQAVQRVRTTPNSQGQQSVSSRPQQITPVSEQRQLQQQQQQQQQLQQQQHQHSHTQRHQHTPSQSSEQHRANQGRHASGSTQQNSSRQPTQTPRRISQPVATPQSTPNSRTLTHVEIPVYRPVDMTPAQNPQQPSAKRRKSNEGVAVSVNQHPQKQYPSASKPAYVEIPKPPESSPLTDLRTSQVVPPTPSPDVDYQSVLLSLSEEYVDAAHGMSAHLCSTDATEEELSQYHKLIATALACLESLLTNYRLRDARKEARVRLRFATLLFEETENTIAAEEFLSKGITFCERNRLTDTKYAMHHLLVRVMYKTNATAATRTLEKLIQEVETMGLTPWIYAFRFLRVSLSVQLGGPSDTSTVLRHLAALNDHAVAHQHAGVLIAASTLEAIVHLQSGDSMAADFASRSLASARTHQLSTVMSETPQLRATIDILELACAFMQSSPPDQTTQKMAQFHQTLDTKAKNVGWTADGSFSLPLGIQSNIDVEADTGGIFRKTPAGELALGFMWFSRSQLYMVGFMLGGISMMNKNGEDRKSEAFLTEGLKLNTPAVDASAMSIKTTEALTDMQQRIAVAIKLLQIYAYCGRASWNMALQAIDALNAELAHVPQYRDEYTACSLLCLTGMCKQALGDEVAALQIYQSPQLSLKPNPHKAVTAVRDLQALAALNSVSIMRSNGDDPAAPEKLLADLAPYCENNHNAAIVSTWHLLRAHDPDPSTSIIKIKRCTSAALIPAQATKNVRIMAIIMNGMTAQFFDGIIGKQALQSAGAGKSLARRSQDSLWVSVGDGIHRNALVRSGDLAGAASAEVQVKMVLERLPEGIKSKLGLWDYSFE